MSAKQALRSLSKGFFNLFVCDPAIMDINPGNEFRAGLKEFPDTSIGELDNIGCQDSTKGLGCSSGQAQHP